MNAPVAEVRELKIVFGRRASSRVRAVDDVTLTIREREILGLVGESGSGKTTVARSIVGLVRPTSGTVLFQDSNVWQLPTKQRRRLLGRRIGLVFQDPTASLNPRLRVRDILLDPLIIHAVGTKQERTRRVADVLDLVGLPRGVERRRPSQLSGGQKQRVAIARAIALNPALLVADEPTSALDVSVQNQILNLLLSLRDELGLSLLLISHNIQVVTYLADRIAVMYHGKLLEHGLCDSVRYEPLHPYTSALLASNMMLTQPPQGRIPAGQGATADETVGCPFLPRCTRAVAVCADAFPAEITPRPGHHVHCWHPEGRPPVTDPVAART